MTEIILTPSEMVQAAICGVMRQTNDVKKGFTRKHGQSEYVGWQHNIEGCMGEMALAKALNLYWGGMGIVGGADVADMDVRTRSHHGYELILHKSDPDDRVFWLVTGINGTYRIRGWIRAVDGKQKKWFTSPVADRPKAYFVPHSALNSPEEKW